MNASKETVDYWDRFRRKRGILESFVSAWSFGDSPELADELLELVLAVRILGQRLWLLSWREKGRRCLLWRLQSVVLDGEGRPVAISRTTSVEVKPSGEVGEVFAYSEGRRWSYGVLEKGTLEILVMNSARSLAKLENP